MTTNAEVRGSLVTGLPFGRVISEWIEAQEHPEDPGPKSISISPLRWLSQEIRMDMEDLRKIARGKRPWIGFDIADKIVIAIDPFLWRTDPELAAIYQMVDLRGLDRRRPCVVAA